MPCIAAETNTINQDWPAGAALTDYITYGMLPGKAMTQNLWAGAIRKPAGFVIDLRSQKTISKIDIRNTNNEFNYG